MVLGVEDRGILPFRRVPSGTLLEINNVMSYSISLLCACRERPHFTGGYCTRQVSIEALCSLAAMDVLCRRCETFCDVDRRKPHMPEAHVVARKRHRVSKCMTSRTSYSTWHSFDRTGTLWSDGSGKPDTLTPLRNNTQWVDPPKWNMLRPVSFRLLSQLGPILTRAGLPSSPCPPPSPSSRTSRPLSCQPQ